VSRKLVVENSDSDYPDSQQKGRLEDLWPTYMIP
jgi:hypothetical protein